MIRFCLRMPGGDVIVTLEVTDANRVGPISVTGDPGKVSVVKPWLFNQTGVEGRLISDRCTGRDLVAALERPQARLFRPTLVEGAGLLAEPAADDTVED